MFIRVCQIRAKAMQSWLTKINFVVGLVSFDRGLRLLEYFSEPFSNKNGFTFLLLASRT